MHDAVRDCCKSGRPLQQPHRTKRPLPTAGKAQTACRNHHLGLPLVNVRMASCQRSFKD